MPPQKELKKVVVRREEVAFPNPTVPTMLVSPESILSQLQDAMKTHKKAARELLGHHGDGDGDGGEGGQGRRR